MVANFKKQLLADILRVLTAKQIDITKIFLHKFIYFLTIQGFTGFRFEPYTYGPYSFNLASCIGSMIFWDEVSDDGNKITVLDLSQYQTRKEIESSIEEKYLLFNKIVDGDYTFKTLECFGTALYCIDVISNYSNSVKLEDVKDEFIQWKKHKYSNSEIENMYYKIKRELYCVNECIIE